jgi:hypothetical protein
MHFLFPAYLLLIVSVCLIGNIRRRVLSTKLFLLEILSLIHYWVAAGVVESVYRLATGWTVHGSNSDGGEIFPHPS